MGESVFVAMVALFGLGIAIRRVAERRYADSPNWREVAALTNGLLIGGGVVVIAIVLFVAGKSWAGVLGLIGGLGFLSLAWTAARILRSPFFDPACEGAPWHHEYKRCRFCGGVRTVPIDDSSASASSSSG